jgi:putative ABC transport system ATP-binding protein
MVTHDASAASYADRVLFLADGKIVDEMPNPTADSVLERMKQFDAAGHPTHGVTRPSSPHVPVSRSFADAPADRGADEV